MFELETRAAEVIVMASQPNADERHGQEGLDSRSTFAGQTGKAKKAKSHDE